MCGSFSTAFRWQGSQATQCLDLCSPPGPHPGWPSLVCPVREVFKATTLSM